MRVTVAVVALVVLLAGCGAAEQGGGVATLGGSSGTTTAGAPGGKDTALAFSRCMRENGVPDFPDPDADGKVVVKRRAPQGGSGPDDQQRGEMERAHEACKHLAPMREMSGEDKSRMQDAMLAFARCMRENGVPDFPDPDLSSGPMIKMGAQGMDPEDPAVKAAHEKCDEHIEKARPGGGK